MQHSIFSFSVFFRLFSSLIVAACLTGCGNPTNIERSPENAQTHQFQESVREEINAHDLPQHNLSVEFENIQSAKVELKRVNAAMSADEIGTFYFVARSDDLVQRAFVFVLASDQKTLVTLAEPIGQSIKRREFDIDNAQLNEIGDVLILQSSTEEIIVTAVEITPMGA